MNFLVKSHSLQKDKSGRTALHWAAIGGFAETCSFLLSHGADLYAKTTTDMNALHAACEAQKVSQGLIFNGSVIPLMIFEYLFFAARCREGPVRELCW